MAVLNLGQKFIPTPGQDSRSQMVQWHFNRFARRVRLSSFFGHSTGNFDMKYHVPGSTWEPPSVPVEVNQFLHEVQTALLDCYAARQRLMRMHPVRDNMTAAMRRALVELELDPSIIVKPSDKNMGLCILDKVWYRAECNRQLSDPVTYKPIPQAAVPGVIADLQRQAAVCAERCRAYMPAPVFNYIMSSLHVDTAVPAFYLLPKLHKLPAISRDYLHLLKGRPIAACHSWVTNAMSVYMADMLNRVCFQQYPQVLPDTKTLIQLLECTTISRDAYLVTFDVESMYPSIDNDAAIRACAAAAATSGIVNGSMVFDMLTLIMQSGYCHCDGNHYQQVQGTVMGTPVAPPYSNIYIAHELEAVVKAEVEYWPRIYKRFIDDGFFVWERDLTSLHAFLHALDSKLPNINLTWNIQQHSIDYMDITISKDMRYSGTHVGLCVTTYQKPHNQYMYIPYHSFHRPCIYKGFIKAELQRYAVTNTRVDDFERMKQLFAQRLLDRGYPLPQLKCWFSQVDHACRVDLLSRPLRRKQLGYQPPVLVLPNGQFEMTARIGTVLNRVLNKHKHVNVVAEIFGATQPKLTVAYKKNKSIAARLIKAKH